MDTLRLLVAEPASQGSRMETRKVFPVLQLFAAVLVALFLAGIVAPSILRYELAGNRALASGSLHSLTIAHITLTYTFWNLASAVLGALFGAAVVAKSSPVRLGAAARIDRAFSHIQPKWRLFQKRSVNLHREPPRGVISLPR